MPRNRNRENVAREPIYPRTPLSDIPFFPSITVDRLVACWITTLEQFVERTATDIGVKNMSDQAGAAPAQIQEWRKACLECLNGENRAILENAPAGMGTRPGMGLRLPDDMKARKGGGLGL
ncbi:TPA: hypothetical protein DDW35_05675 [Candidatus Sumerlaeota bacterium]|nr:hypothetical protein [Candidatus Sumerlaeota bacterium]